jgi:hypothetical protein
VAMLVVLVKLFLNFPNNLFEYGNLFIVINVFLYFIYLLRFPAWFRSNDFY